MPDIMLSSSHIIPHSCTVREYYHSPCLQVTALKCREVTSLGSGLRSSNTRINPVQSDSKSPHITIMQCCSRQFLILGNQNLLQRFFFSKTSCQDSYQRAPFSKFQGGPKIRMLKALRGILKIKGIWKLWL